MSGATSPGLDVDSVLTRLRSQYASGAQTQQSTAVVPPKPAAPALPPPTPDFQRNIQVESGGQQFGPDGQPLVSAKLADDPNAPVGAAQVRPTTAQQYVPNVDLTKLRNDKGYNESVGSAVKAGLLKQYGGSQLLANAAYNAGPGAVDKWIQEFGDPRTGQISPEDFAAKIPFDETRAYLHQIGLVQGATGNTPEVHLPFDVTKIYTDMQRRMAGAESDASEELKGLREAMKKLEEPAPTAKTTPPEQVWGSAAMALAAIGGLLTHTPVTAAMNAMAGVINGFRANDQAATKRSMDQWKAGQEAVMKATELRMSLYESAMKKMAYAPEEAKAEMAANAAALQDTAVQQALAKGDVNTAMAIVSGGYASAVQMQREAYKFEQSVKDRQTSMDLLSDLQAARASGDPEKIKAAQQALADHWAAIAPPAAATKIEMGAQPSAGSAAKTMSDVQADLRKQHPDWNDAQIDKEANAQVTASKQPTISDDAADLAAERVLAGDERATIGMARSAANITKVTDSIVKLAKEKGMSGADIAAKVAEFQGTTAGERTLGTRTANMEIAANEVKNMAPLALAASNQVDRSKYPRLNSILLAAEQGTGDENVVRFGLAANSLIYTYAKFLNPTGIPTDADKAKATDILSTAWAKGQFAAAVDQIKKEIQSGQGAIKATKDEFHEGVTGAPQPQQGALPPAAVSKLTEGHVTTFANGQKWTLHNGQPEQVQ